MEYIETAGGRPSFSTGIVPGNAVVSVDFDMQLQQYVDRVWVFDCGTDGGNPGGSVDFGIHNSRWSMKLSGMDWGEFAPISYDRIQATWTINGNNNTATISGDLSYSRTSSAHFGNNLLWRESAIALTMSAPDTAYPVYMKFYSTKIHLDNTLVFDGIPAKRKSDGAVGMYDLVSGDFFKSESSDEFIAGPAVNDEPSCEYTRLEYLTSTAAQQYIEDNSFDLITTGAIEIKTKNLAPLCRFAGWGNKNDGGIMDIGLATPNSATNYFPYYYNGWVNPSGSSAVNIANENKVRLDFEPGKQKLYINDNLNRQTTNSVTTNHNLPFGLFRISSSGYNSNSTIYYCRVFDGNDVLLRNYIPVRRNSDNVLGMYDTVTNTFFTNAGTGTFIAGPTITSGNNCSATISITWGGLAEPDASGMCTYGETFTAPSVAPTAPSGLKFLGWRPIGQ